MMLEGTLLANDMMDGGMMGWGLSWLWIAGFWILQVVLAAVVYQDAQKHGKNGLLWSVLVIIPMIGYLFLLGYLIARDEQRPDPVGGLSPRGLLDARYARGELSRNEYLRMKDDLEAPGPRSP